MRGLPMAAYPGNVSLHSREELRKNVVTGVADQIVKGLTVQPAEEESIVEPEPGEIVFEGSFEEVNRFFYESRWTDGIPVVPPTPKKIAQFLRFTVRQPDEVLGVLLPDRREATIQNIAINGVMAGCRPEYMPVLIAIVEAMLDPRFGQEHLGHTPGTEVLITLNGPIIKELGFNYEQGALRVGKQANTSVGRFWRLFLTNVAGFLLHQTDKGTFGGSWRVVLAENEDALSKIGWAPMSVDMGFKEGDNVVTISSCTSTDSAFSMGVAAPGSASAEMILGKLAERTVDAHMVLFELALHGPGVRPQILISPCIAEFVATRGFSKERVKRYLYEHATFPAKRFERIFPAGLLCDWVKQGKLPELYCRSSDPERMVPIVSSPDDFMITVSGDPDRDNCFICGQNGFIGYPVSRKIELPPRWGEMLKDENPMKKKAISS